MTSLQPADSNRAGWDNLLKLCQAYAELETSPKKIYFEVSKKASESIPAVEIKKKTFAWRVNRFISRKIRDKKKEKYDKRTWDNALASIVASASSFAKSAPNIAKNDKEAIEQFKRVCEGIFKKQTPKTKGILQKFRGFFRRTMPERSPKAPYQTVSKLEELISRLALAEAAVPPPEAKPVSSPVPPPPEVKLVPLITVEDEENQLTEVEEFARACNVTDIPSSPVSPAKCLQPGQVLTTARKQEFSYNVTKHLVSVHSAAEASKETLITQLETFNSLVSEKNKQQPPVFPSVVDHNGWLQALSALNASIETVQKQAVEEMTKRCKELDRQCDELRGMMRQQQQLQPLLGKPVTTVELPKSPPITLQDLPGYAKDLSDYDQELLDRAVQIERACQGLVTSEGRPPAKPGRAFTQVCEGVAAALKEGLQVYQRQFAEQRAMIASVRQQLGFPPVEKLPDGASITFESLDTCNEAIKTAAEDTKSKLKEVRSRLGVALEALRAVKVDVQDEEVLIPTIKEQHGEINLEAEALLECMGKASEVRKALLEKVQKAFGPFTPVAGYEGVDSEQLVKSCEALKQQTQEKVQVFDNKKQATLKALSEILNGITGITCLRNVEASLIGHRNTIESKTRCGQKEFDKAGERIEEAIEIKKLYDAIAISSVVVRGQLVQEMEETAKQAFAQRFAKISFDEVSAAHFYEIRPKLESLKAKLEALQKEAAVAIEIEKKVGLLKDISALQKAIRSELQVLEQEAPQQSKERIEQIKPSVENSIEELVALTKELEAIKGTLSGSSERKIARDALKKALESQETDEEKLIALAGVGDKAPAKSLAIHLRVYSIIDALASGDAKRLLEEFVQRLAASPGDMRDELEFLLKKVDQKVSTMKETFFAELVTQFKNKPVVLPLKGMEGATSPYCQLVFLSQVDTQEKLKAAVAWLQNDFGNQLALNSLVDVIREYPKGSFGFVLGILASTFLPDHREALKSVLVKSLSDVAGEERQKLREFLYKDVSPLREPAIEACGFNFKDPARGLTESMNGDMRIIRSKGAPFSKIGACVASYRDTLCLELSRMKEEVRAPIHPLFIGSQNVVTVANDEELGSLLTQLASLSSQYPGVTLVSGGIGLNGEKLCPVFEDGRLIAMGGTQKEAQNYFLLPNGTSVALGVGSDALQQAREAIKLLPVKGKGPDIQICLGSEEGKRIVREGEVFIGQEGRPEPFSLVRRELIPEGEAPLDTPLPTEAWQPMEKALKTFRTRRESAFGNEADWQQFVLAIQGKNLAQLMTQYRRPFLELLSQSTQRAVALYTDSPGYELELIGSGEPATALLYSFEKKGFFPLEVLRKTEGYKQSIENSRKRIVQIEKQLQVLGEKGLSADFDAFQDARIRLGTLREATQKYLKSQLMDAAGYAARSDTKAVLDGIDRKVLVVLQFLEAQISYLQMPEQNRETTLAALGHMMEEVGNPLGQEIATQFRADQLIDRCVEMGQNPYWEQVTIGAHGLLEVQEGGRISWLKNMWRRPVLPDEGKMVQLLSGLMGQLGKIAPTRPRDATAAVAGLRTLQARYAEKTKVTEKIDEIIGYFRGGSV